MAGAPKGNQNGRKAKRWENALTRALARISAGKGFEAGLDPIADKVVSLAINGDKDAWQEIANRLDGKHAQSLELNANITHELPDAELDQRLNALREAGAAGAAGGKAATH
jgi:hypothetical protein